MPKAIIVHAHGGPDSLSWEDFAITPPGLKETQIRHTAIGLNFIDVYLRTGLYPPPQLPFIPGFEAAGIVEAVGAEVSNFSVGDRVAYASGPLGAYAEYANYPAERLIKLPDGISEQTAAAAMLKGMTAEYLVQRTYPVTAGDTLLVHAAAGGVGQLLCQWAADLGAMVIGCVGSDEKAALAREKGCHHTIVYPRESIVERVREMTDGTGVAVVYDSVGQATFQASLDSLKQRGTLVSFGQSSGKVEPFDIIELSRKGSLYVTRPTLFHYVNSREDLVTSANALFERILQQRIEVDTSHTYTLREAAQAHADLEDRRTHGSSILIP